MIAAACESSGAEMIEAEAGVSIETRHDAGTTSVHVVTPQHDYGWVRLGLRGDHQIPNALVAIRLLEAVHTTMTIAFDEIVAGIRDVRWPGRLHIVDAGDGRRVLLDAAHNPAGASVLARYLAREFPEPLPLVFAAMRDKDVVPMLKALLPIAGHVVMTQAATPRARDAAELAAMAVDLVPRDRIAVERDPAKALERAWSHGPLIVAAGSIFLIGDLLAALGVTAADAPVGP